ncbi:Protein LATERAL ROOT PRIMORDIUM 1 [Bienertia sinuspersici]
MAASNPRTCWRHLRRQQWGVGVAGGTTTCQDCGNQAKKDCSHRRCRTCCRSRGFDCSTHVKSTWVPAARRRERQMIGVSAGGTHVINGDPLMVVVVVEPLRLHFRGEKAQADFKRALRSHYQGQVKAPAVFKCVKVTAVDDGEDEFAYQAVVKIVVMYSRGFYMIKELSQEMDFLIV